MCINLMAPMFASSFPRLKKKGFPKTPRLFAVLDIAPWLLELELSQCLWRFARPESW